MASWTRSSRARSLGHTDGPPLTDQQESRLQLAATAFQRAHQLAAGARPRVDADGHKPTRLAVLELLADRISWSVEPETAALVEEDPETED